MLRLCMLIITIGYLDGLLKKLHCRENAADLTQDTFIRLLRLPNLPLIEEPKAYLGTIAHGLVVDQARRRKLERLYFNSLAQLPEETVSSAEDHAIIVEAVVRIDSLLSGLKPRIRTVLLLSRLHGMTYKEIALKLKVSLSTVEKDMALAIRHCYQARYVI